VKKVEQTPTLYNDILNLFNLNCSKIYYNLKPCFDLIKYQKYSFCVNENYKNKGN
jgi:hypothetical protein